MEQAVSPCFIIAEVEVNCKPKGLAAIPLPARAGSLLAAVSMTFIGAFLAVVGLWGLIEAALGFQLGGLASAIILLVGVVVFIVGGRCVEARQRRQAWRELERLQQHVRSGDDEDPGDSGGVFPGGWSGSDSTTVD